MIEWIATCDTGVSSMTMWECIDGGKTKERFEYSQRQ